MAQFIRKTPLYLRTNKGTYRTYMVVIDSSVSGIVMEYSPVGDTFEMSVIAGTTYASPYTCAWCETLQFIGGSGAKYDVFLYNDWTVRLKLGDQRCTYDIVTGPGYNLRTGVSSTSASIENLIIVYDIHTGKYHLGRGGAFTVSNVNRAYSMGATLPDGGLGYIAATYMVENSRGYSYGGDTFGDTIAADLMEVAGFTYDPYAGGGNSEPYEGDPTFDESSDTVPVPEVPTFSFSDAGFTRIYNPNLSQLQSLSQYMWTDQTFLQTVVNHAKQLLENPVDAIIALNLIPCSVANGSSEEVKILYIPTGVYMPPVTNQFVEVDCGSVSIDTYYASALDYSPYTTIELVLPFIGQVSIDTDEVMGHTMHVRYRVDVVTGMCIAIVSVDGIDGEGLSVENVLYQFTGHCAVSMPITSADFSAYIAAAIGAAKTGASVAAAGATGVASTVSGAALSFLESAGQALDSDMPRTEEKAEFGASIENFHSTAKAKSANYGELAKGSIANTVSAVMSSKPIVEHSGGFTGNSGYMGVRRPYLIIKRPNMCNPSEYGKYNGRPCMMYLSLGKLSGFTQVQEIQLTDIPATNPELATISALLKSGVIL